MNASPFRCKPRPSSIAIMRATITAVVAAAFTLLGAAQDLVVQSGVPVTVFPRLDRPVANIVSPIWHDEKERDDAGEPGQLVCLLGIKSGMTVADIGAGSMLYDCRQLSDQLAKLLPRMSC